MADKTAPLDRGLRADFNAATARADAAEALLRDVRIDLAALMPDPWNPSVEDWPVSNPADAKCLQDSYIRIRGFFVESGELRK